jgi:hypothetical protein
VRFLTQLSRQYFSIQPNQDALHNTVVSACLVHLVMRHIGYQNSCHVMSPMFSKPVTAKFLLTYHVCQPPVLPSLLVLFKQAEVFGLRTQKLHFNCPKEM